MSEMNENQQQPKIIGIYYDTNTNLLDQCPTEQIVSNSTEQIIYTNNLQNDKLIGETSTVVIPCNNPAILEDPELETLLVKWNLRHLYDHLINEKITIEILNIIKREHLAELFKGFKMGDRISFEHNLEIWRDEKGVPMNASMFKNLLLDDNVPSPSSPASHVSTETLSNRSSPYTGRLSPENTETKMITLGYILNKNPKGPLIMEIYKKNSKLDEEQRNMLISIIANYFESQNLHLSISTSYRLEREIIEYFPNEKLEYYRTGKRGKIYVKYCNLRRNLKSFKKLLEKSDPSQDKQRKQLVLEKDVEQYIKSLKFDDLTADEFDSCWQACSQFRIAEIMKEGTSIEDIFKNWPQYKSSTGYRLIDKDYSIMYEASGSILNKWEENIKKIYLFLCKDNNVKDHSIKSVLNSITSTEICSGSTSFIFKVLWSLHGYLSPTSKIIQKDITGKKQVKKFTIKDSQESFIYFGKTTGELEQHIQFLKAGSENIQPFILALGEQNFENFEKFLVYLDNYKFLFNNFLRAVDVCFKTFHLFNLQYPAASSQFWTFIELYFYKISTKNIKKSAKIFLLIEEMEKI